MRCAVTASLWPASTQIACELKTQRDTLKKWVRSICIFSEARSLICTSCWTSQFVENLRFLHVTHPWCSMKFYYGAFVHSPTGLSHAKYKLVYPSWTSVNILLVDWSWSMWRQDQRPIRSLLSLAAEEIILWRVPPAHKPFIHLSTCIQRFTKYWPDHPQSHKTLDHQQSFEYFPIWQNWTIFNSSL